MAMKNIRDVEEFIDAQIEDGTWTPDSEEAVRLKARSEAKWAVIKPHTSAYYPSAYLTLLLAKNADETSPLYKKAKPVYEVYIREYALELANLGRRNYLDLPAWPEKGA